MGELTTACGQVTQKQKIIRVEINRLVNGFIVGGYGVEQKIANTLDEALALAKKELE